MVIRASSRTRKLEILQFVLMASDVVWRRGNPFFGINSNKFEKDHEIELDYSYEGHEDIRKRVEETPGRKIFREYVNEMVKERLLVRIITNDKRSKFYSITPLGIIHLIKSERFFDGIKYPHPEKNYVILTLLTFAQQSLPFYKNKTFEKERFFRTEYDLLENLGKWQGISLRHEIPHVFTNVNVIQENMESQFKIDLLEFNVTNGYHGGNKITFATFDFREDEVQVSELDYFGFFRSSNNEKKKGNDLHLTTGQFHHYLANLMLCALIYDFAIAKFDSTKLFTELTSKKQRKKPNYERTDEFVNEINDLPEDFLRILFLFSNHILRIIKKQHELVDGFNQKLNIVQLSGK